MKGKIGSLHLDRQAYVYVRQSTSAQVHEHVESKQRQYALAERAVSLGWSPQAVEIVDEDQGKSGASAEGRDGFARLASDVAHGKVGAIFAIEASRLARSSQDWQRLLSLCSVAHVAVIDEQTVYDPSDRDDKLLLDLKGAMSEQELHWLSLRLAGGRLNKARRGESYVTPSTGYIWGGCGLELDPDESVQRAVKLVFERFSVEPSARAVLRWGLKTGFLMPTRERGTSEVRWGLLGNVRLNNMLRNPAYAGVYVFGRHPVRTVLIDGQIRKVRARLDEPSEWPVRIVNAHPAYISWETYVKNQDKLRQNTTQARAATSGAPREGVALLVGVAICGRCGRRMSVRYNSGNAGSTYACWGESSRGESLCWSVAAPPIDRAIERLFLQTMVPDEIELSLAVEREVDKQADSLDKAWRTRVEQARYEARRAERRYKAVDPDNRVVARTLEREWEDRLRELETVERQHTEARREARVELTVEDRRRIRELARDLPAVWLASTTGAADRKAMLRLAIEAIALHPVDVPRRMTRIRVQWQTGTVTEIEIARPPKGQYRTHAPEVVQRIRDLAAAGLRDDEIAGRFQNEGLRTKVGLRWSEDMVRGARRKYGISRIAPDRPRMPALPERHPDGRYSVPGAAIRFGVTHSAVYFWIQRGLVTGSRADFGTHRDVYWLDIDDAAVRRINAQRRSRVARKA